MDTQNENVEVVESQEEPRAARSSFLDKMSCIFIAIGALLAPLFFLPSTSYPFQVGKIAFISFFVLIGVAFWLVARLKVGRFEFSQSHLNIGAFLVLISALLSAIFSGGFRNSFVGGNFELGTLASLIVLFALFFVSAQVFNSKGRIFGAYLALFAVTSILALYQLLKLIIGPDFLSFGIFTNVTANFLGKWNDLAVLFGLSALISALALEIASLSRKLRITFYGVFTISLALLAIVNFDTAWVVLAVFSLLLIVYLGFSGYKNFPRAHTTPKPDDLDSGGATNKKRIPILPVILLVVSAVFITERYAFSESRPLSTAISNFFQIFQLETRPSWSATLNIAKESVKANPIFGAGPNTFVNQWQSHKPAGVNETVFWSSDFVFAVGLIPTFIISTGLLGLLSWLLFAVFFLSTGLKLFFSQPADRFSRYLGVTSFLGALYLFTITFFYVPSLSSTALAFFLSGLLIASLVLENTLKVKTVSFPEQPKIGFALVVAMIMFLVLSISLAYAETSKFLALWRLQKGVLVLNTDGNMERAENLISKSLKTSKTDTAYRFLSELKLVKLNQLVSANQNLSTEAVQNQFKDIFGAALSDAQAAVSFNDKNYQNYMQLGRVYESVVPLGVQGAYDNALRVYNSAMALNPTNPEIDLVLARLEVANRNFNKAKERLAAARAKKTNYLEAVFFESQLEAGLGNIDKAITAAEAGALIAPNDAVIHFQLGVLKFNDKDYRGAVTALERAVGLNPVYANARYFLGLSYERVARDAEALAQFEEIRKTNPDNKELPTIIKNIKAGRTPFAGIPEASPENRNTLPVSENGAGQ